MKCNWCGKGIGRNYTRDVHGKLFYYFCVDCVKDYKNELTSKEKTKLERGVDCERSSYR